MLAGGVGVVVLLLLLWLWCASQPACMHDCRPPRHAILRNAILRNHAPCDFSMQIAVRSLSDRYQNRSCSQIACVLRICILAMQIPRNQLLRSFYDNNRIPLAAYAILYTMTIAVYHSNHRNLRIALVTIARIELPYLVCR